MEERARGRDVMAGRLAELSALGLGPTVSDAALDGIVALAARVFRAPIAVITLVDDTRQWFVSSLGLAIAGTSRDVAFCAVTVDRQAPLVVPDATRDPHFAANPLVVGPPYLRAYAGHPLITAGGHAVGTLAVMDRVPRDFTDEQIDTLRTLAMQVERWLELRRTVAALADALAERDEAIGDLRRAEEALSRQVTVQAAELDQMQAERRRVDSLYRTLFETSTDAVLIIDAYDTIRLASPSVRTLLQYAPEELVGQPLAQVQPPRLRGAHAAGLRRYLQTGQRRLDWRAASTHALRRDGSEVPVDIAFSELRLDGEVHFVGFFRDMSERQRLTEQLTYRATHDALTGLVNRNEFERRLRARLDTGGDGAHTLLYLDLDQFKVVNDTCGHAAGDEMLRQLAGVLRVELPDAATLSRLGGDEFVVMLDGLPPERAMAVAETLRAAIADFPFAWNGAVFHVGVCIGAVHFRAGEPATVPQLLGQADEACYMAKELGRNRVQAYHADDAELARRHGDMERVAQIRQALKDDRFVLYRQDIVALDGRSDERHAEILVRMLAEDGTLVPPMAFIPAAERFHLMPAIDRWIIAATLARVGDVRAVDPDTIVAINLSGGSVSDPTLAPFILDQLAAHGIVAKRICFEITETDAIRNLAHARELIQRLRAVGCRFALDDFGSGMSSLAYLKSLPVDYLKIDGSFVRGVADDPVDRAMVAAINQIGHLMGLRTIAEFVEDARVLAELRAIGVDLGQGYAVARPRPLGD